MNPADISNSIFEHPFYRSLLAGGVIPGEDQIPSDLLQAVAILIGRVVDTYVDPRECKGLVALAVLGMRRSDALLVVPEARVLPVEPIAKGLGHTRNKVSAPQVEEASRA